MADGEIDVSPSALKEHAQDVRGFMSGLDEAAGSAGEVMDINAFGIIGMTWAGILTNWTGTAQDFLKTTTEAGQHVADQLTRISDAYTNVDAANAKSFQAGAE
jgi:hypothetical protein